MFAGCGSTYTLKKGGWVIQKSPDKAPALPSTVTQTLRLSWCASLSPEPVKLPKSILDAACPKCVECPPAKVEEKSDGAE